MSARNTRATVHAPRSQRTSTRPLPKSWTPNRPVSRCPQTVNAVHSRLWTKAAELKHYVIRLRSLVNVQSKTPYVHHITTMNPYKKQKKTHSKHYTMKYCAVFLTSEHVEGALILVKLSFSVDPNQWCLGIVISGLKCMYEYHLMPNSAYGQFHGKRSL